MKYGLAGLLVFACLMASACSSDATETATVPTPMAVPAGQPTNAAPTTTPTEAPTDAPTSPPSPTSAPAPEPTPTIPAIPGLGGPMIVTDIVNFTLADLTVSVGTAVLWSQLDTASHTTTSGTPDDTTGLWDSATMSRNQTFTHTFNEEGIFHYFCRIHPGSMRATVTVTGEGSAPASTPPPTPDSAILEVRVTNDPLPESVTRILITVDNVQVSMEAPGTTSGWRTVVDQPTSFDLLEVAGVEEFLGTANLTPGRYNQVRLEVVAAEVTLEGVAVMADVPSNKLRIVGGVTAVAGETTILTLDFDAGNSVVVAGKGKVILKPTIKLLMRTGEEPFSSAKEVPSVQEPAETPTPTPPETDEPPLTTTPDPTFTPEPASPPATGAVTLPPSKDNTLYEDTGGALSNGGGDFFFAGKNGQGATRRGVIAFDVAAAVPVGSIVTTTSLILNISRTSGGGGSVSLHRLLANWGEGKSNAGGNEGRGGPASPGGATWIHSSFDSEVWATPGGDFNTEASAVTTVAGTGGHTWESTLDLVGDVQAWLDDPGTNFGWLIMGNEARTTTANRFDSRYNVDEATRPVLMVEFIPG